MKKLIDKLHNIVFELNEFKAKMQAIENEVMELDQSLQKMKFDQMEKERKWKIPEIVMEMKTYIPGDRNQTLAIVANYCNEKDALILADNENTSKKYYPVWSYDQNQVTVIWLCSKFNTPHFNSMESLLRLIKENEIFFTNLLNPANTEIPHEHA